MKGVFLLSADPELFALVERIMLDAGAAAYAGKVAQLKDDQGRLLTVFGELNDLFKADMVPDSYRGPAPAPDVSDATGVWVECRWEQWFVEWVAALAAALPDPLWVLDGNGVLWSAADVDPDELVM